MLKCKIDHKTEPIINPGINPNFKIFKTIKVKIREITKDIKFFKIRPFYNYIILDIILLKKD